MKRFTVTMLAAAALVLAGCSTTAPEPPAVPSAPPVTAADVVAPEPTVDRSMCNTNCPGDAGYVEPAIVNTADSNVYEFEDGLVVTFDGATIAMPEQVGSDPVEGSQPVILAFTYQNGAPGPVQLQQVPLTVQYGADLYAADQPTLYNGDTTHSEIPQQITAGSTVSVINTYWIPAGEPITVTVNVSGSDDQVRAQPTFTGITVG